MTKREKEICVLIEDEFWTWLNKSLTFMQFANELHLFDIDAVKCPKGYMVEITKEAFLHGEPDIVCGLHFLDDTNPRWPVVCEAYRLHAVKGHSIFNMLTLTRDIKSNLCLQ